MEMSEIYNGSHWAHDIYLVNKAGATEYITGRSSILFEEYNKISWSYYLNITKQFQLHFSLSDS